MGQYIGGSVCLFQDYKPRLLKVRPLQETPTTTHVSYTVGGANTIAKEWAAIKQQEEDEEETPTSNNIPTPTAR